MQGAELEKRLRSAEVDFRMSHVGFSSGLRLSQPQLLYFHAFCLLNSTCVRLKVWFDFRGPASGGNWLCRPAGGPSTGAEPATLEERKHISSGMWLLTAWK